MRRISVEWVGAGQDRTRLDLKWKSNELCRKGMGKIGVVQEKRRAEAIGVGEERNGMVLTWRDGGVLRGMRSEAK